MVLIRDQIVRDQISTIAGLAPLCTCLAVTHWSIRQLRLSGSIAVAFSGADAPK